MNRSSDTGTQGIGRAGRCAAMVIAVVFIALGVAGMIGVWVVERWAAELVTKRFELAETAASAVDAGMARMNDLVATGRTEVREAVEAIAGAGRRAEANRPVLSALGDRLETALAPRIAQMQKAMAPVRDAVMTIGNAVEILNSLPGMTERAPRLAALDGIFDRLEELASDTAQWRGTLRTLAATLADGLTDEIAATLNALARRVDTRLVEVQTGIQGVQADIAERQVRMDARKSRMLFVLKLLAVLGTLMLVWILYCQCVVIRHHRSRMIR